MRHTARSRTARSSASASSAVHECTPNDRTSPRHGPLRCAGASRILRPLGHVHRGGAPHPARSRGVGSGPAAYDPRRHRRGGARSADVGIVPIENSIEGSVAITLDTLAFESELLIQREVDLPISLQPLREAGNHAGRRDERRVVPARHRPVPRLAERASCPTSPSSPPTRPPTRPARSHARSAPDRRPSPTVWPPRSTGSRRSRPRSRTTPRTRPGSWSSAAGFPHRPVTTRRSIVCFQRTDRPGSLLAILQEFAARVDQPHEGRVAVRRSGASATTASSSTSRATSPTSSWPTASGTSRRARRG